MEIVGLAGKQSRLLEAFIHRFFDLLFGKGLGHKAARAPRLRKQYIVLDAVGAEYHDTGRIVKMHDIFQQIDTTATGQMDVEEHDIGIFFAVRLQKVFAIIQSHNLAVWRQCFGQQ